MNRIAREGRLLRSFLLAAALADPAWAAVDLHQHDKVLGMVGPDRLRHLVARRHPLVRLHLLLQPALRILRMGSCLQPLDVGGQQAKDDVLSRIRAQIQVNGADQRLKDRTQGGRTRASAALFLAVPELEVRAEIQLQRHARQRLAAHEGGTQVGEVAFLLQRKEVVEPFAHQVAQHRVAEKLQPLVVDQLSVVVKQFVEKAAMNKSAVQQRRVAESNAQPRLDRVQGATVICRRGQSSRRR